MMIKTGKKNNWKYIDLEIKKCWIKKWISALVVD